MEVVECWRCKEAIKEETSGGEEKRNARRTGLCGHSILAVEEMARIGVLITGKEEEGGVIGSSSDPRWVDRFQQFGGTKSERRPLEMVVHRPSYPLLMIEEDRSILGYLQRMKKREVYVYRDKGVSTR